MAITDSSRAAAVLAKAMERVKVIARKRNREVRLAVRIAVAIYMPENPSAEAEAAAKAARKKRKVDPKYKDARDGGHYLGWNGLSTKLEFRTLSEARDFERAFTVFCELLHERGPGSVLATLQEQQRLAPPMARREAS